MYSTQKKSLALVGAGHWGKNLARNFHALGALHTICDSKDSLLSSYSSQYPEINLTTNFQAVLANPEIEQVVIAAPASLHYKLAKQSLLAGKDTYVEKPLCLNSIEGEELIELAAEKGLILMVGHLLQYHPCVVKLQEMVSKGEIGKLEYIVSNRLNLGQIRLEENALWSFAPHDISVILSLCHNQLPEQVRCSGGAYLSHEIADTTMTLLKFKGNVRAHIYVSWLHPFKEQKLVVIGSSGMLVFDDTKPWEEKLLMYSDHVTWTNGMIPLANKSEAQAVTVPQSEPLKNECEHFLHCCANRINPKTDGKEGLRVLKVLQSAQKSLDTDGEAQFPTKEIHYQTTKDFFAHPTAVIDNEAEVGPKTKIWHFSHVMQGAKIGAECNLGQNVVISPGVVLGKNVKIQNNVSVYTGVICEDDVFLGPSMVFTNVINPRSAVNRREEYLTTHVRKGASIGANATIVCGNDIGCYAFIGAGTVITSDVKPFALMVGNPGKQIGWMSRHGERLNLPVKLEPGQEKKAVCPATGEVYILKGEELALISNIEELNESVL